MLEEGSADVEVEHLGELVNPKGLLGCLVALFDAFFIGRLDSCFENALELLQRVGVHGVDLCQIHQHKEKAANSDGDWLDIHSDLLNSLHDACIVLVRLLDVGLLDLRLVKHLLQTHVFQNVLAGVGNRIQDLVLDLCNLARVLGCCLDTNLSFLILCVLLDPDDFVLHLVHKTFLCYHEVKKTHFHTNFWTVVWGAHFCRNIELKFFTEGHDFITEFDCHLSALFLNLFSENWIH